MDPSVRSPFPKNKLLLGLFIFFIIFIVGQLGYYYLVQKPKLSPNNNLGAISPAPTLFDIFDEVSPNKPLNELNYEQVKAQVSAQTIQESRFEGVLLQLKKTTDGLELELESTLRNSQGKKVWYQYYTVTLPKIIYTDASGETLSIDNLKPGDRLTIDENNDYSKDYPESIVRVKITKL